MSKARIIDYYDLIELPSGRHIPVPVAIRTIGLEEVLKIPVANKKRNRTFYFCEKCREYYCEWYCYDDWSDDFGYAGGDCSECLAGYSFFRCMRHKPLGKFETQSKLAILEAMIHANMHEFLKYIETDERYARTKGYVEIRKCEIATAYGEMVDIV